MNTKIKKISAFIVLIWLLWATTNVEAATQVGTGTVTWSWALSTPIIWNDQFPWTASGSIDGIVVTAQVLPILNMIISSDSITLGTLNNTTYSTGTIDLEVGTNASNGVIITAKSKNGWLSSVANGSIINNLTNDGIAESYKFSSVLNAPSDSSIVWYTQTANLDTEINNTNTNVIYSTNKPEDSNGTNDVEFSVWAKISTQTPAWGDYKDTIIFSVTWNF